MSRHIIFDSEKKLTNVSCVIGGVRTCVTEMCYLTWELASCLWLGKDRIRSNWELNSCTVLTSENTIDIAKLVLDAQSTLKVISGRRENMKDTGKWSTVFGQAWWFASCP